MQNDRMSYSYLSVWQCILDTCSTSETLRPIQLETRAIFGMNGILTAVETTAQRIRTTLILVPVPNEREKRSQERCFLSQVGSKHDKETILVASIQRRRESMFHRTRKFSSYPWLFERSVFGKTSGRKDEEPFRIDIQFVSFVKD